MVVMKCMTTKKNFECDEPEVILLKNKRFAYKAKCPWKGKHGNDLYAYKFATSKAYHDYIQKNLGTVEEGSESDSHSESE